MIIHCENAWRAPPLATQLLETSAVPPSRDRWYFVSLSARRDQRRSNHIPNAGNRHDAVKYIGTANSIACRCASAGVISSDNASKMTCMIISPLVSVMR